MKKIKYRATLATGEVFTRTCATGRQYTHFWHVKAPGFGGQPFRTGFAGTRRLAVTATEAFRRLHPAMVAEIVPVEREFQGGWAAVGTEG